MPESAAVRVALLCSSRDDIDELRDVLREAGAHTVFESDTQDCDAAAIHATSPTVVLINLPESGDEHSPMLDELAASPELRVIFNDASITSTLTGWDRARWRRHLSAKIMGLEGDLPPRPEDAPSLRLPRMGSQPFADRGRGNPVHKSEQSLADEMQSGLAQLADAGSVGPPPRHDWASELDAEGTLDVPLDSLATDGVAQQAMGAGMESTGSIEVDSEALGLNEDERALLGNLQAFDADGEAEVPPPRTMRIDEQRVDEQLDASAFPGIQVDDFAANDLGSPLGAADEELRLHEEITSDEAVPAKLDAPPGFAELSLAPLDAEHAVGPTPAAASAATPGDDTSAAPLSSLELESLEGGSLPPIVGRASYAIDTSERFVVDLTQGASAQSKQATQGLPGTWVLLGGGGSEVGMLELLGELPPTLPVAFVVVHAGPAASAAEDLPIDAWPEGTALAAGQVVSLDPARAIRFDDAGRLEDASGSDARGGIDAMLVTLSEQYRDQLGLLLFEGQSDQGCDGVAAVIANGGTVWSTTTGDGEMAWNTRAQALGGLACTGTVPQLAQRLTEAAA